jgi:transposase
MLTDVLFPAKLQLSVDKVEMEKNAVNISVTSTNRRNICPHCQTISERVHSSYNRHPADLPLVGYTVRLDMAVHRFFCDNDDCEARTFTERIPAFIQHYARRTHRLATRQQSVAIEAGGAIGQRVLTILDMPVNSDTLIRFIRNEPEPDVATPRVVGVDEWSKRKGQSYGTILVDLEAHQPVDLLPDKSAESFAKWLREHPGVEVISRDRGVEYIKGATQGAPDAIQVADRWHLLKNLRDALKRLLENNRACLKAAADKTNLTEATTGGKKEPSVSNTEKPDEGTETTVTTSEFSDASTKLTKAEKRRIEGQARRQERFEAVKELHGQGFCIAEIARQLNMDWKTVNKYVQADECPVYPEKQSRRPRKLDPYKEYITERWQSGCHSSTEILNEIRQQGYNGSRSMMMDWVAKTLKPERASHPGLSTKTIVPWSPSRASWLLVSEEDELTEEDKQALERMKQADGKVAEAYHLGQRFSEMVRERQPEALSPWLEDATSSGIDALKQFAKGIKQDLAAVTNALSLPWSNGQTEGQVNRLKLIKRQMYGRANFDLLRRRVLARPIRC